MTDGEMLETNRVADTEDTGGNLLGPLLAGSTAALRSVGTSTGVVIGELIGLTNGGKTPLVRFSGQPGTAAIHARCVVDLCGAQIGQHVVLMFEAADPGKPIVMGVLRSDEGWPLADRPGGVEVDADGERLIVSSKEQLVLRCGNASITLTKSGKVLIQGSYVLSRSSGVNRIKGGSVQLN